MDPRRTDIDTLAPPAGRGQGEGQASLKQRDYRGKDQKRAERARLLRHALTPAEFTLWTPIRGRRLGSFKFARQEPIDRLPPPFPPPLAEEGQGGGVCRERRLIIELDGGQHAESPEDRHRDRSLGALGYRVIRIWNNDVIENLDVILQGHLSELEKSPLTPALSPQAGRGR